jgi:hypothetical protein
VDATQMNLPANKVVIQNVAVFSVKFQHVSKPAWAINARRVKSV